MLTHVTNAESTGRQAVTGSSEILLLFVLK